MRAYLYLGFRVKDLSVAYLKHRGLSKQRRSGVGAIKDLSIRSTSMAAADQLPPTPVARVLLAIVKRPRNANNRYFAW